MNYILAVFDLSTHQRVVCIGDCKGKYSNLLNKDKYPYAKWTDVSIGENKFTRGS